MPRPANVRYVPESTVEASTLLTTFDLLGIFVFAISGALLGVRRSFDVFGVLVLALTAALGGGFLRDVLIGATPPAALVHWEYLVVPVVAGFLTFFFHGPFGRAERVVNVFDALGLGLFCVTGALKAASYGLNPLASALLGMVTAIGGGMMRDLLANRPPAVFTTQLYATPALAGAAVAVVGDHYDQPWLLVGTAGALVCVVWRLLAIWGDWHAPRPRGPASV